MELTKCEVSLIWNYWKLLWEYSYINICPTVYLSSPSLKLNIHVIPILGEYQEFVLNNQLQFLSISHHFKSHDIG